MKFKYTSPRLYHSNFDLSKKWFVAFRFTDIQHNITKQFQYRGDINKHQSKAKRLEEARALIQALSEMLESGFNPLSNTIHEPKKTNTQNLIYILNYHNSIRENTIKPESSRTYKDVTKVFSHWLKSVSMEKIMPDQFSKILARKYLDHLLEKGYGPNSHNKHLSCLITLFNLLLEREIIKINPFVGIRALRKEIGKNIAFTASERSKLSELLKIENPNLFFFVQFMFYCAMRRTEILKLKICDIDLINNAILIRSDSAKNRKQETISIPPAFKNDLLKKNIRSFNPNFYVFSKNMIPGPVQRKKPDAISNTHRKFTDRLKIDKSKGLYSWKHTGTIVLYNEIKDPYSVMRHLRHHDLQTTMIYLKSLGLNENKLVSSSSISI